MARSKQGFGFVILSLLVGGLLVVLTGFQGLARSSRGPNPVNLTQSGTYDSSQTVGTFLGKQFISAKVPDYASKAVLGDSSQPKHINVDLAAQRLYAFEGDRQVFEFRISTGKWGKTPTGTFTIANKFRYIGMSGGSGADAYNLPNVPYVMFFGNSQIPASAGFSFHGTYWHDNFGHPMSHGCVNMRTEDAGTLFYWADPVLGDKTSISATKDNPGTQVIIYGTPPEE
ncbi:MAG TPA: L,D-transpeptidase [Patescibacteria group bacterium]|nr:L,D-transpeptidase [Patescibacteria group bacterium]